MAVISEAELMIFGDITDTPDSVKAKLSFTREEQLIGFWGTQRVSLESIGIISYKTSCMDEAVDEEATFEDENSNEEAVTVETETVTEGDEGLNKEVEVFIIDGGVMGNHDIANE